MPELLAGILVARGLDPEKVERWTWHGYDEEKGIWRVTLVWK
jgi:hypothetical protein